MNSTIKAIIFVACLIGLANCNLFMRGRRFLQHKRANIEKVDNITDQYYDQRLDHFNEALTTTWKQV